MTYKKFIRARLKLWYDRMGLFEWKITSGFSNNPDGHAFGDIRISHDYLRAEITFYPVLRERWKAKDFAEIDETIVHELSHLLTEPLYVVAVDAITNTSKSFLETVREQQTQRITQIILRRFS